METFSFGSASAKQIGYHSRPDEKILCERHAIPFLPLQPAFDLDGPVTCPYCEWEIKMDYQAHAARFLLDAGLDFRAVLVGNDCPQFCEDSQKDNAMDKVDVYPRKTHIHGKHYRCTISAKNRGHVSFDFWNSYSDEEFNALGSKAYRSGESHFQHGTKVTDGHGNIKTVNRKRTVSAYDLLACIVKYEPGTFENFCSDYGYDTDSRKAEEIYRITVKEWHKVEKFFTPAELTVIQEIS